MRYIARTVALCLLAAAPIAVAKEATEARPIMPGHVSTAASEVRLTFSPDGARMLWGAIGWTGGAGGWDIYESVKTANAWSKPKSVSFNAPENDFDPFFAPDGKGVYFFSNRPGGLGKDDIYFVPFDKGAYGKPRNLGPNVNSPGDDWAPALSSDGQALIFSSDGRGGEGKQDLFLSARKGEGWAEAQNFGPPVNGPSDDFDAMFLPDDSGIVLAVGDVEGDGGTKLHMSVITPGGFVKPQLIGPNVNCDGGLVLGPSVFRREPKLLYFTSNCRKNRVGRMDIFRAPMPEYDWSRERNVQD
jgi:hypothetical protein